MRNNPTNEIAHGEYLSKKGAERIWGWNTPAGLLRAKRRGELIIEASELRKRRRVLEIGCGTGMFTEMFAFADAKIVALDISGELLKIARKRKFRPGQVEFIEKPFEAYETECRFDAIIGSSILHHLDLRISLPKIFALLKPGGVMSFAEPNMLNPQIFFQKNIPFLKKIAGDSPDETAFVRWHLHRIMASTGFCEIKISPFDWLHPLTPTPIIPLIQKFSAIIEKMPVISEFSGSLIIQSQRSA